MNERTRTFQCPGCFSVSDLADRGRGHWYECECGERLTMIDLRGDEMIPSHEVIRPARERDEARAEAERWKAEAERLRDALDRIAGTPSGVHFTHGDGTSSYVPANSNDMIAFARRALSAGGGTDA